MFAMITDGLQLMLANIWIVPIGVLAGMWIGAMPGLGASASLAVLLPVLLNIPPELGLILGISIYAGAEMGNSFPAILINIPGTAASAVTTFDGYPMMLRGEGARALGICIMASVLGALVGGIASISAAPALAMVALKFSPVEICIIILFGIAVIGQLSAGGLAKGVMAGTLGLFLATIGTDPIFGQFRGTFGSIYLIDGLAEVSVLVGVLGFSELLMIIERGATNPAAQQLDVGLRGIVGGFRDVLARPVAWIRGSVIGVFIGCLPGAGGSIASFVAYQQALAAAPPERRKEFGKGAPEGLLAPDSANNAMVGGALVPLLTLGIPGSATMAVLLVVMGYHGLPVGPNLFVLKGDIAYALLWSQFVAAGFILVIGTVLASFAHRITQIPMGLLASVIAAFCLIGGFAKQQLLFDMGVMLVFGVLGYFMKKHQYSPVALVLGLILGGAFEANLFQGLQMGFGSPALFFTRPIALLLWALLLASILGPTVLRWIRGLHERKRRALEAT